MTVFSVADAKNRLPSLIDKALAGEEVVITRRGTPVVELRPVSRQGRRLPARMSGCMREPEPDPASG